MFSPQSVYSRDQIYYLSSEKYDTDVVAIGVAQQQWIGQAVMARNDENGFYYPGSVYMLYLYVHAHTCTQTQRKLLLSI